MSEPSESDWKLKGNNRIKLGSESQTDCNTEWVTKLYPKAMTAIDIKLSLPPAESYPSASFSSAGIFLPWLGLNPGRFC